MNSVIGGLLTSGRSTVRSMARPSAIIAASAIARAATKGTPRSRRLTKVERREAESAILARN